MKAGLNLFSVNKLIQTESGLIDTLIKLKEMGYDFVQFSGAKYDCEMLQRAVKESGLPIVLTHVPFDLIVSDPIKLLEEHRSFGCSNIGLGAMPFQYQANEKVWKEKILELNSAAEKIAKAGGKFFYHHHHFEFTRFSTGETVLEFIKKNAPYINFTLDSYWLQYGGQNVENFADDIIGRVECVHLKDYQIECINNDTYEFKPNFAPVGNGVLNMPKIIDKWAKAGAKYFLVEQDNASSFDDVLGQVKISIDYLKSL